MKEKQIKPPNLSEFSDYRNFLGAWYDYKKSNVKGFSYTTWSKVCGFSSRSFLRDVIQGKKNLTDPSLEAVSRSMNFSKEQSEEFYNLAKFNQAKDYQQKETYFKALSIFRMWKLNEDQLIFYSRWYHSTIREMAAHGPIPNDPALIASVLNPRLSAPEVKRSLDLQEKLGLIEIKDDAIRATQTAITTGNETFSHFVKLFHQESMELNKRAIDAVPGPERDLSILIFSLSESAFKEVKHALSIFRKELAALADRDAGQKKCYTLTMAMIPTTDTIPKKER